MGRIITVDSQEADSVLVFLNGYVLRHWISAEDGEEGWVDVLDTEALQQMSTTSESLDSPDESDPTPMEALPIKRIKGKVSFKTK